MTTGHLDYFQKRIFSIHAQLVGLKKTETQVKYIELAKKIPLYGVLMFDVTEGGSLRKLGIAEDGFLISKKNNEVIQ